MDPNSNFPFDNKQPRKELLGPRPTPLRVHKDSQKIKKPPLPPLTSQQQQQQHHGRSYQQERNQSGQQSQPFREPVIIYTVSPKVIHAEPSEFMMLVQRLTGSSSTSSSTSSMVHNNSYTNVSSYAAGAVSPAARYATLENASKSPKGEKFQAHGSNNLEMDQLEGNNDDHNDNHEVVVERRSNLFPGILSPGPSSLQPIQPSFFFSPPPSTSNPDTISGFYRDLSPVQHGNNTYIEGSFMNSPTFFSPYMISPTLNFDIFNNFLD